LAFDFLVELSVQRLKQSCLHEKNWSDVGSLAIRPTSRGNDGFNQKNDAPKKIKS
jgi:hypothetical protein